VSALAEALVAAQTRAVAALGKQYVGGAVDDVTVRTDLESIGLTDDVDTTRLLAAWDILRSAGAPAPNEQPPNGVHEKKPEPASQPQLDLIARLIGEKGAQHPDLPLTKAEAHEVIDTLKAGTYDYAKWHVAF
jgi:hypothetical protein